MKLAVACDHAAVSQKDELITHLRSRGHDVQDLGCAAGEAVDYPDQAATVARAVLDGEAGARHHPLRDGHRRGHVGLQVRRHPRRHDR